MNNKNLKKVLISSTLIVLLGFLYLVSMDIIKQVGEIPKVKELNAKLSFDGFVEKNVVIAKSVYSSSKELLGLELNNSDINQDVNKSLVATTISDLNNSHVSKIVIIKNDNINLNSTVVSAVKPIEGFINDNNITKRINK